MAPQIALNAMTLDKLIALRSEVDAMLSDKVAEHRQILKSKLATLDRIDGTPKPSNRTGGTGSRGNVAPKYRNPDNPDETWAGRGLRPRWLTAALKAGGTIEAFSVEAAQKVLAKSKTTRPAKR